MFLDKSSIWAVASGWYGWSGEAVDHILARLKSLKLKVPPLTPLKIKLIPNKDELKLCYDFGVEFAQIVQGKMVEISI